MWTHCLVKKSKKPSHTSWTRLFRNVSESLGWNSSCEAAKRVLQASHSVEKQISMGSVVEEIVKVVVPSLLSGVSSGPCIFGHG